MKTKMNAQQRAKAAYYRRGVGRKIENILQRDFCASCLLRCHYSERTQVQPQEIINDLRAFVRRAKRRRQGVRYMAYATRDAETGAPCLQILVNIPRADCRAAAAPFFRSGCVDLLQPDAEQLADFSRCALALLDDDTRIFSRPLFMSRSGLRGKR